MTDGPLDNSTASSASALAALAALKLVKCVGLGRLGPRAGRVALPEFFQREPMRLAPAALHLARRVALLQQ